MAKPCKQEQTGAGLRALPVWERRAGGWGCDLGQQGGFTGAGKDFSPASSSPLVTGKVRVK